MDGLRNIFLGVNNRFATTRSDITVQSGSVARTPVERDRLLLLPLSRECKARWWRTPWCNFQRRIYTAYNELATPLRMHRAYSSSAQDDSLKVLRDVFFWNVADVSLVRHCNFFFSFSSILFRSWNVCVDFWIFDLRINLREKVSFVWIKLYWNYY